MQRFLKHVGVASAVVVVCILAIAPLNARAAESQTPTAKDETVYVYTDATGSIKDAEVSVTLKNDSAASELRDSSNLSDIKSKDDVAFTRTDDAIVWAADGKNVSYTGKTNEKAPITLNVTYSLDGKTVTPEQLAGKSGRVTIRYEFENHTSSSADINGTCQTVYTPFTCISAIMLDGDDFKNVSVENCKVINDGDDMIVAGYAIPGLKESLGDISENASIPESFSITADVTDFELKSTMTVVTAGLLSDVDADSLGLDLNIDTSALTDAMNQLIEGSDGLSKGLDTLAESLNGLEDGTSAIKQGTETIGNSLSVLAGEEGLKKLADYEYAISDAIGQIADSADDMKGSLLEASSELAQAAEAQQAFDGASGIMAEHMAEIVGEGKLSPEEYESVMTALGMGSQMSTSVSEVAAQLEGAASSIDDLKASVEELQSNAAAVASEIENAASSVEKLAIGANELEGYADQLNQAAPALTEGTQAAADGSKTLTDGLRTFNDEGVSQIADAIQDEFGGAADRVNALADAAKSYTNFSGITPGTTGSVKFVIETDPVKKA